jgi:peptidoglycan hydrolase CwlO-like protein
MAQQQADSVQEGIDRFREVFGSFESEFERVQKDLRARRKLLEKRFDAGRKDIEKRARKVRKELRKNPTFKRLDDLRRDTARQLEQRAENLLSALQIASKSDVQRIDRKLTQLNRKLKELERTRRTNGPGARGA